MFLPFLLITVLAVSDPPEKDAPLPPQRLCTGAAEISLKGSGKEKTEIPPSDLPELVREYALPASVYQLAEPGKAYEEEPPPFLPDISAAGKGLTVILGIAVIVLTAVILNRHPNTKE